ncbi:hypothetical protein PV04_04154 [Phialophora macrospora]|uniref:Zn(2)-C6 fungal-type domain-containing protein n=1 Tax=Phialophora macrospora TaxID=1851006 RepID=A0A0D2FJB3_9EURO|nr:hypothetical protein PV04_04154 [Phialophora macrospora]
MPSRRFHKKSRFGCKECKGRRIKCDESRPSCGNCVRSHAVCLYAAATRTKPAAAATPYHTPTESETQASVSPSPLALPPASLLPSPSSPPFELIDLVLMNHFTAVTSLHLFSGERQAQLWQQEVPRQAGSSPMLMHGLLAVAALHLAQGELEPSSHLRYQSRGFYHHALGLQLFNAEVARLPPQSLDILFTFAILLAVWVYASPVTELAVISLDDVLDKLEMVRGCKKLFEMHREAIIDKPIGRFAEHRLKVCNRRQLSPASEALSYLRSIAADAINLAAIDQLESALHNYACDETHTKTAAVLPAIVSDKFWARLRAHEPLAVLIFAHYAIMSHPHQGRWWWMAGWPERILQAAEVALTSAEKAPLGWENCVARIRSGVLDIPTGMDFTSSEAVTGLLTSTATARRVETELDGVQRRPCLEIRDSKPIRSE